MFASSATHMSHCFELTDNTWQGFTLMDETEMSALPTRAWHPHSRPRLSSWLQNEQDKEAQSRLHMVGNCIMPDLCRLALNILGHEMRKDPNA